MFAPCRQCARLRVIAPGLRFGWTHANNGRSYSHRSKVVMPGRIVDGLMSANRGGK